MKRQTTAVTSIILFSLVITLFSILSNRIGFTDSAEYIDVAKAIAGMINTNVFVMHSIVYSLFLGIFLKIFPYLLTLKLLNAVWLILDAIFIYFIAKDKKALYIWIFSPIAYYMSTWISPMLPISFLFLLAYYCIKRYEADNELIYLAVSALSIGLIAALRGQMIAIAALFFIIFFYNKQLKTGVYYLLLALPTFAIRLLVDYYYFGNPFYTLLTFSGSLVLGGTEGDSFILSEWYFFPFIIAPLTFLLYKLDFRQYKREIIFLALFLLTTIPLGQLRFFMPVAPFVVLLLSSVMTRKQLIINILISIVIISVIVYPYFITNTREYRTTQDLNAIHKEINPSLAVVTNGGAYSFPALATDYWSEKSTRYIWSRDLQLFLANSLEYRNLALVSKSRFDADKIVTLQASSSSNRDKMLNSDFLNSQPYFILAKEEYRYNPATRTLTILWRGELNIQQVNLVKCYQELCVFRKY